MNVRSARKVTRDTRTKWDDKREASYETLVRSAMHAFQRRGYAATTVADIVAGTGYTPGAFYHLFANKADCFWHVIAYRDRLRGDWFKVTHELRPAQASLQEVLERVFASFETSLEGTTRWVLVMVDFHQQHHDDPQVQAQLAEVYGVWRDNVARFIDELQANGWIAKPPDVALLARQVFAFVEGTIVHATLYGRADSAVMRQALIDGLVTLLRS